MQYVLQFPDLSVEDKVLWSFMTMHSGRDANLMCSLSLAEMATSLGMGQENIRCSLLKLQEMGFVCTGKERDEEPIFPKDALEKRAYYLSLPSSGLLALKMAVSEKISERHHFLKEDTPKLAQHKPKVLINLMNKLEKNVKEDLTRSIL